MQGRSGVRSVSLGVLFVMLFIVSPDVPMDRLLHRPLCVLPEFVYTFQSLAMLSAAWIGPIGTCGSGRSGPHSEQSG